LANIKSQVKRNRQNERRRKKNASARSSVRTARKKIISLCRALKAPQNLTYRYGIPGHLELAYPDSEINEQGKFYTSSSPLFGGEVTYLTFRRGVYEYKIYSKIGRMDSDSNQQDRIPMFEDGIDILKNGNLFKQLVCDDGGEGFREDIRWLPNE